MDTRFSSRKCSSCCLVTLSGRPRAPGARAPGGAAGQAGRCAATVILLTLGPGWHTPQAIAAQLRTLGVHCGSREVARACVQLVDQGLLRRHPTAKAFTPAREDGRYKAKQRGLAGRRPQPGRGGPSPGAGRGQSRRLAGAQLMDSPAHATHAAPLPGGREGPGQRSAHREVRDRARRRQGGGEAPRQELMLEIRHACRWMGFIGASVAWVLAQQCLLGAHLLGLLDVKLTWGASIWSLSIILAISIPWRRLPKPAVLLALALLAGGTFGGSCVALPTKDVWLGFVGVGTVLGVLRGLQWVVSQVLRDERD